MRCRQIAAAFALGFIFVQVLGAPSRELTEDQLVGKPRTFTAKQNFAGGINLRVASDCSLTSLNCTAGEACLDNLGGLGNARLFQCDPAADVGLGDFVAPTNLGAGGGAPISASYLTLGLNGPLTNERVFTCDPSLSCADTGANGTLTILSPNGLDVRHTSFSGGAKCDGVTNDTAAIQAAINFCASSTCGEVRFPPGTCMATQIEWKRHIILQGSGVQLIGNLRGTRLQQIAGTNTDFIITDTGLSTTAGFHSASIRDMTIRGNSGDATGNGIKFNTVTGEATTLERVRVDNFPQNGIFVAQGSIPFYAEDLHLNTNGDAGLRMESGATRHTALINMVSGDDNLNGLVYVKTGGGTGNIDNVTLVGVKGEKTTAGRQNNAIVVDDFNGSPVTVVGARLSNSSAEAANAVVRIITSGARISWSGLAKESDVSYIIDDAFASLTYTDTSGVIGLSNFIIGAPNILFGIAQDVQLSRAAANRIGLGSDDSLRIPDQHLILGAAGQSDVSLRNITSFMDVRDSLESSKFRFAPNATAGNRDFTLFDGSIVLSGAGELVDGIDVGAHAHTGGTGGAAVDEDSLTYNTNDGSRHDHSGADVTVGTVDEARLDPNVVLDTETVAGIDSTAIHDNQTGEISALTEKVSPVGADLLVIEDSAASNAKKKVQITNLPAGAPGADSIGTNELDDGTDTPVAAECVKVAAGAVEFEYGACGSGTPGGSDTQVQYNDVGAFGGDAGLTYNETTDVLTAAGGFASTGTTSGKVVLTEADPGSSTVTHSVDGDIASSIEFRWPVATAGYGKWAVAAGVATLSFISSITDADVSDTLTASLFVGSGSTTTAVDLATAEAAGTLTVAKGGTNLTAAADDNVMVGNATTWETKAIPTCNVTTQKTHYNTGTNTWTCETDAGGGGGGDNAGVEDGDNAGTFTAATDADFEDSGDINFVLDTVPAPDQISAQIRAGAVTDAEVNASGITTRSKLPTAIAYEDEANVFVHASGQEIEQSAANPIGLRLQNLQAAAPSPRLLFDPADANTDVELQVTADGKLEIKDQTTNPYFRFWPNAGIGGRDLEILDGDLILGLAGGLIDGKDISGQAVFKNEANTYSGGGLQDFGAMGVKIPVSDTALAAQGRVRVASTGTGAHYYDTATRQLAITGSDIANSQAGTCVFAAGVSCTVSLPVTETDANYIITQPGCSGAFATWITGKTTTQFVINASTSNSDTCDWRLIR